MTQISRRKFVSNTATVAGATILSPLAGSLAKRTEAAPSIPFRPLGKTGAEVTMIGLGGGSRFYLPVPDDEQGAEMVRQTIDRGICFIETAANYGPKDESERRIGMAMKTHRSRVFLETKTDARDYDGAMREMERSLKFLETDKIDLMLHHNVSSLDEFRKIASDQGAEKAVRKMVDQKVVRFRGFSCHFPDLTLEGIRMLEPHAIQAIINATQVPNFEKEVLPLTSQKGIGVVVMKSIGKGYFLRHNFTKPDRIDQYGPPATAFERKDLPEARDYIHYALTLPVSTVVIGIDSMQTLNAVVRDVAGYKPLSAAQMKSITDRAQVFRTTGFWLPQTQPA
jgi:aryl-alcohol dehydrogenase-like predicted oxidoreductase